MRRRTKRGGWPYSQPPNVPFEINWDSQQADGLVLWMPWGGGTPGSHHHVDRIGNLVFTEGGTPEWRSHSERGWMLHFTRAGEDCLTGLSSPVVATPLTLSAWFVVDSSVGTWTTMAMLTVTDPAVGDPGEHFRISVGTQGTNTAWRLWAETRDAAWESYAEYNCTGDFELHHILGVFRSPTDRRIYYDGLYRATNNTDRTPAGIDRTTIGVDLSWESTANEFWGLLADARIYDRALTDTEVWQLYAEPWELYKPLIRRWPGWKSPIVERIPRYGFTNFQVPGIV